VSDRVAILRAGNLVRTAALHELHELRFHQVELEFAGPIPLEAIRRAAGVDRVEVEDHLLHCIVRGSFAPLMQALAGSDVINVSSHEPSLEDIFLTYYRDTDSAVLEAVEARG
jgi:ABC-2 type transport system ATP-binding protein